MGGDVNNMYDRLGILKSLKLPWGGQGNKGMAHYAKSADRSVTVHGGIRYYETPINVDNGICSVTGSSVTQISTYSSQICC